jgi:ribose transport system ATP-binding protein
MGEQYLLTVKNMYKSFGPTKALVNVDFDVRPGEIHGLIGENGSGKSTLSSIIAGIQPADEGTMVFKNNAYKPTTPLEAAEKGICMLMQEKGTFDTISVVANIFVGKEAQFCRNGYLNTTRMYAAARQALDNVGAVHIDERTKTEKLSFEDQKQVEIARAIYSKPDILIVDETTTALTRNGRELLYDVMGAMRNEGKSVIFISHDLDEVISICDRITVLRDGHIIRTLEKDEFDAGLIRQLMVGRQMTDNFYRTDDKASRDEIVAIRTENLCYGQLKNVNIQVHFGEIVGFGGLTDCGMHDLGKLLFGRYKPESGRVTLSDGTTVNSIHTAVKNGIGYVSKDRDKEALMLSASITDNISAPNLKKLQRFGIITSRKEKSFANDWASKLSIKMQDVGQRVMYLSGGNKQKVSVGKWLGYDPDILIFDCPTRGIDIGVKAAIYQLMMELKKQGKAIIMISEELMEVIGMSDRVITLKNGEVTGEFTRDEGLTESRLIEYII